MAYHVKRAKSSIEELELVGEDGKVEECLKIDLSAASAADEISAKYMRILDIQKCLPEIEATTDKGEAYRQLGEAVVDLYKAALGSANAEKLLAFYENRYTEMIQETYPFIRDVVIPKLRNSAQQARKNAMQGYKKKQHRPLVKRMWNDKK